MANVLGPWLRDGILLPALKEGFNAVSRFATPECLTAAIGTVGFSGIQGQIGAMIVNSIIYGVAEDEGNALGELGSFLGPELAVEYTKATLKTYGIFGQPGGGVYPHAATAVKAVRAGGNVLASGVSVYHSGRSAGVW